MIHKGSFFLATVAVLGFARYAHADSCKDYMSSRADYTLSSSGEEGMAWDGYKTKGGYYKTLSRISNVDECFTKCADRSRCSSFTYSKSRRTCALSTQEGATSSAEVSSGTVEFCGSSGRIAGFVVRSQVQPSGKGYTADEVAKHNSVDSAWVVYDGKVYDLTDFVNLHPGGRGDILRAAGTDATAAFDRENSHREAELLTLKTYYIGDFVGGGMDSQLPEAAVDDDGDDTDDDDDDTDDDDDDRFDDDTDDDDDDDDRYDTDNDTDDDDD